MARGLLLHVLLISSIFISLSSGEAEPQCGIPAHLQGQYYTKLTGADAYAEFTPDGLTYDGVVSLCHDFLIINSTTNADGRYDVNLLVKNPNSNCGQCWKILARTPNILQARISDCQTDFTTLESMCDQISATAELRTFFRTNLETVNCKSTFEGVYRFTYEENNGGGGVCDNPNSMITACQEPGSRYFDNEVFTMEFKACQDIGFNEKIRFQCMGEWRDEIGQVWSAMANLGKDVMSERFRCMLTREDQQRENNQRRYSMSRWSECDTLKSPYEGDFRLVIEPVIYGNQLIEPSCKLPRNFTGTWFTTGEFDSDVTVNATHIYFKTKIDQYTYRETYFTCQQTIDSRVLMTAVTVGKCEVDFVCFDFVPRHHNIVRWRMSRPYRMDPNEINTPDFLTKKFRQACAWTSFTIDRTQKEWTYHVFVLNPPAPVECPIAGRYFFTMTGTPSEFYKTRVEGITERPRHQIDCRNYTSTFQSCSSNTNKIAIDVEYCETVDHTGRPIGEYDIADNELTCVGFWMEDMRSYMITYDEWDAVSNFRCWVYERLDWRLLRASRSNRATCARNQRPTSSIPEEGASLAVVLRESERLFDDCPQRFNLGKDPYSSELTVYFMNSAHIMMNHQILVIFSVAMSLVVFI